MLAGGVSVLEFRPPHFPSSVYCPYQHQLARKSITYVHTIVMCAMWAYKTHRAAIHLHRLLCFFGIIMNPKLLQLLQIVRNLQRHHCIGITVMDANVSRKIGILVAFVHDCPLSLCGTVRYRSPSRVLADSNSFQGCAARQCRYRSIRWPKPPCIYLTKWGCPSLTFHHR